jgi:hypothetical protein
VADQERDEFDPLAEDQLAALGGVTGEGGVNESSPARRSADVASSDAERMSVSTSPPAVTPPEADPDEEPPEPEGHALTEAVEAAAGPNPIFRGLLPPDVASIWGAPPMRAMDEATARVLIEAWGLEGFRGSSLHTSAVSERARGANVGEARTRFKTERESKKKR